MTMKTPVVSFVFGSYNRRSFLKKTLESIRDNGLSFPYEIIAVDGGSTDGSLRYLERQKDVITIIQHNRGTFRGKPVEKRSWGYFMNLGFKAAQGKYICMISDDCLLVPGSVDNGVNLFERLLSEGKKVGAMAFYWRNWPGKKDYCVGTTLGDKLFVNHGLYNRQALQEVGWCDEETYGFYHADGDLCLKLWQAGYTVVECPDAFVEHYTHANIKVRQQNLERQKNDWRAYLDKWAGIFYDPAQNNKGAWHYKAYTDNTKTYARFPAANGMPAVLKTLMRQLVTSAAQLKKRMLRH
ncbi:MAG: glycosyltransferase [Deltaproteobacteria bacterium]|nr:glycosyltransferase [Deltaproteobacteria bacterium]